MTTANGFQLVNGPYTYNVKMEEGRVYWQGSYGGDVDLTNRISGGRIGGLLNLRERLFQNTGTRIDLFSKLSGR